MGLTRREMAAKLGINKTNYYKNEIGYSLLGIDTMNQLHMNFDISIDWLLFDSHPMHNKEKQQLAVQERGNQGLEAKQPDVKCLLAAMEQDNVLLHEIMLYFYKYKQEREAKETTTPTPLTS
jgi:transcriptional regulator with XRE-family HTH domain